MNKGLTPRKIEKMRDLPRTIFSTNVFVNPQKKLRNGWWIVIYFLLLVSMLVPLTIWSRENGGAIAMWQQALISLIAALVLQLLRRQPMSEMFGRFDLNWLEDFGIGSLMGECPDVVRRRCSCWRSRFLRRILTAPQSGNRYLAGTDFRRGVFSINSFG